MYTMLLSKRKFLKCLLQVQLLIERWQQLKILLPCFVCTYFIILIGLYFLKAVSIIQWNFIKLSIFHSVFVYFICVKTFVRYFFEAIKKKVTNILIILNVKKVLLEYWTARKLAANVEYLRRTGFEIRSARNQSYIKDSKVQIKNQS